jgi:hypothetical protein
MKKETVSKSKKTRTISKKEKQTIGKIIKQKYAKLSIEDIGEIIENILKILKIFKKIGLGVLDVIILIGVIYKEINKLRKPVSRKGASKK